MNVLMLSTDRSVFEKDSAFRARLFEYQKHLGKIEIIVLGMRGDEKLNDELRIMGVLQRTKLATLRAAYKEARGIVHENPASWMVTTQDEFTGLIGYWLRRRLGVAWRAEVHTDILSPWFGRVYFMNTIRKLIFLLTIKKASCVRVVSERIRRSIEKRRLTRAPIFVIPVKPVRPRGAGVSGSERYFLVASRLTYEKNISQAIRAFKEIAHAFPDTLLKIVGDGPQKSTLERLALDLGIRNRVVFLGWQKEVGTLFSNALGFLSTSWYEGFGLSILEAMSVGCPVITTDVGIVGDILKHEVSGIVVPHNDRDALVEAMVKCIKDPEYRARLGKVAQEATSLFFDEAAYWQAFDVSFSLCKPKN